MSFLSLRQESVVLVSFATGSRLGGTLYVASIQKHGGLVHRRTNDLEAYNYVLTKYIRSIVDLAKQVSRVRPNFFHSLVFHV